MNIQGVFSSFSLWTWILPFWLTACDIPKEPKANAQSGQEATLQEDSLVISWQYLMGQFQPETHPDFIRIRPEHASNKDMYMRKDAYLAFCAMYDAAKKDGINLKIVSAARNFERQKAIWEAKWEGLTLVEGGIDLSKDVPDPVDRAFRILRFSSMPGTSRHHWGTDIDLNHLENEWFASGEGLRLYTWLTQHAASYGYCQPYTPKGEERPHGYEEEKWHWSYLPVSSRLTQWATENLNDAHIQGFAGDSTAVKIGVVEMYVLGIHPGCK